MRPIGSLIILFCFASLAVAGDFLGAEYYFPIVTKTSGLGGTDWLTEVSLANPQDVDLVITVRIAQAGTFSEQSLVLPAGGSSLWEDFLGEVAGSTGNAALYLVAEVEGNGGRAVDCLGFSAAVRIYNSGSDAGTYGQAVPPLDPVSGLIGDWPAYFAGVRTNGSPGSSGFRTNIGFWNLGETAAVLRLQFFDAAGTVQWQQDVTAERHQPFIMGMPEGLSVGMLRADPLGQWLDCTVYISVVDNQTGDAALQTSLIMNPELPDDCSADPRTGEQSAPLRQLFLGGRE